MKIKETSIKTFQASIFIGLEEGYTKKQIDADEVIGTLQTLQLAIAQEKNVYLSASLSHCNIVLNYQNEPHLKFDFINYPKFPQDEELLKENILFLAKMLMITHDQNRMIVIFPDETIMLEQTDEIDPRTAIQ